MKRQLVGLLAAFLFISCSKFQKVMKLTDFKAKYQAANQYYDKGDYYRANIVYMDLVSISLGRPEAEMLQFRYAYSYFHLKQYQMSAHYFKQFYDTYGRSTLAEEALYRYAHSLFMDTPDYFLDQSGTNNAIAALQDFLNKYPKSQYATEAIKQMSILRQRLEKKAYENAKQYQKLGYFKSAVIAYDNFLKDYPDSQYKEEIAFLRIESSYELAKMSIESLKTERYTKTINLYLDYIDKFPASKRLKEAEKIYSYAQKELKEAQDLFKHSQTTSNVNYQKS
ncbi:MAG: outer membrane protein assembly factor BamD [Flammeovirgaceae bacterium]|nr:outer membrane protein assembly factor BamD [Flammeovirgaceae bacterium]MDW8286842.1 outer membrane protein assembly factor BamD [Flammeovirgaceae bacterium]